MHSQPETTSKYLRTMSCGVKPAASDPAIKQIRHCFLLNVLVRDRRSKKLQPGTVLEFVFPECPGTFCPCVCTNTIRSSNSYCCCRYENTVSYVSSYLGTATKQKLFITSIRQNRRQHYRVPYTTCALSTYRTEPFSFVNCLNKLLKNNLF